MGRWISPDRPTDFPARLALWLGVLAFLPVVGPAIALAAAGAGTVALVLCKRHPERYTGKPRIYAAFALLLAACTLFLGEGAVFLRWKLRQAYDQKVSVSRFRLAEVSQALERYRQENGAYPSAIGILALEGALRPRYVNQVSLLDGFGQAISAVSQPDGFAIRCFPPPFSSAESEPPVLSVESTFKPAPPPPPPPATEGGGTGAAGEGAPAPATPQA